MVLVVKMPYGTTIILKVVDGCSIKKVKGLIKASEGTPRREQRLIFQHGQLEDGRTLLSYSIRHRAELTLLLRLGGGGKRGRATTPGAKEELKVSKPDKIGAKKEEMLGTMLRLKELKHQRLCTS